MKQRILIFLTLVCLLVSLAACGGTTEPTVPSASSETEPSTQAPTETPTEAATESPTDAPTQTPTQASTEPEEGGRFAIAYPAAQAYRLSTGEVWVQLAVAVENRSDAPLFLDYANFTLLDESGLAVTTRTGVSAYPQVITPGETGYYYDEFSLDTAQTGELTVHWDEAALEEAIHASDIPCVRYSLGETRLLDSPYGGMDLTGVVENTAEESGQLVCIAAVLLDEQGQPLGLLYTILSQALPAGASSAFELSNTLLPSDLRAADVAEIVTFAYPLQAFS